MRRSQIKGSLHQSPSSASKPSISQPAPAIGRHLLTPCRRLGLPLPKKRPKDASPALSSGPPLHTKTSIADDVEELEDVPKICDDLKKRSPRIPRSKNESSASVITSPIISVSESFEDSVSSNGRKKSSRTRSADIKNETSPSKDSSDDSPLQSIKKKSTKRIKSSKNIEIDKARSPEKIKNGTLLDFKQASSKTSNSENICLDKTSNMSMISNFDEFVAEVASSPTLSPIDLVDDDSNDVPDVSEVSKMCPIQPQVVLHDLKSNSAEHSKDESQNNNKRKNGSDSHSDDDFDNQKIAKCKKLVISKIYSSKVSKSKENKVKDDKSLRKYKSATISSDMDKKKSKKTSKSERSSPTKSRKPSPKSSQCSVSTLSDSDDDFKVIPLQKKPSIILNETADLTRKIEDIEKRLDQKRKMLISLQSQSPKVNECVKLQELITKWRAGCQEALNELLDFNKKKEGSEKINMEELLGLLHIPHDLVKYNQETMDFE